MTHQHTPEETQLAQQVIEADARARDGRTERLKVLAVGESAEMIPMPALAHEYFEEARLCWYTGAFVATILICQLTIDEFFRSHYRAVYGVGGALASGKKVEDANLPEFLAQAATDGLISTNESEQLDQIRQYRNPFVHSKDVSSPNSKKPDFFRQTLKIAAPELIGVSAQDEARTSISTLVALFPAVCLRSWGLGHGKRDNHT